MRRRGQRSQLNDKDAHLIKPVSSYRQQKCLLAGSDPPKRQISQWRVRASHNSYWSGFCLAMPKLHPTRPSSPVSYHNQVQKSDFVVYSVHLVVNRPINDRDTKMMGCRRHWGYMREPPMVRLAGILKIKPDIHNPKIAGRSTWDENEAPYHRGREAEY